jgi:membrane dipeptidase
VKFATFFLVLWTFSSVVSADDQALYDRVASVLKETPLIDGHNDIPYRYRLRVDGHLEKMMFHHDLSQLESPTHTDLPRLKQGKVGAQFWSVYIPIRDFPGAAGAAATVLQQMDFVHRLVSRYPQALELAYTADDIERIHSEGRIASLMGIEGGHAIENSLATLRGLYRAGARYMTLTHSKGLRWADSSTDEARVGGLSHFGREVIREMNRIGMMVDLSHVSPATMHDALDVTRAPVIFSHSSAYALTAHDRNIPDDVLIRVKENGGIAMVTFFYTYVSEKTRLGYLSLRAEVDATTDDPEEREMLWEERFAEIPRPTLYDVADHIDHIRHLIGVDHIGIGGDYDGMPPGPVGLEDVSTYPALFVELLRRGYSDDDIAKIAGDNLLRVMRQVEAVAREESAARPASSALIDEVDEPITVPEQDD